MSGRQNKQIYIRIVIAVLWCVNTYARCRCRCYYFSLLSANANRHTTHTVYILFFSLIYKQQRNKQEIDTPIVCYRLFSSCTNKRTRCWNPNCIHFSVWQTRRACVFLLRHIIRLAYPLLVAHFVSSSLSIRAANDNDERSFVSLFFSLFSSARWFAAIQLVGFIEIQQWLAQQHKHTRAHYTATREAYIRPAYTPPVVCDIQIEYEENERVQWTILLQPRLSIWWPCHTYCSRAYKHTHILINFNNGRKNRLVANELFVNWLGGANCIFN